MPSATSAGSAAHSGHPCSAATSASRARHRRHEREAVDLPVRVRDRRADLAPRFSNTSTYSISGRASSAAVRSAQRSTTGAHAGDADRARASRRGRASRARPRPRRAREAARARRTAERVESRSASPGDDRRPPVLERADRVRLRGLEPADAERARRRRQVRPVLTVPDDETHCARIQPNRSLTRLAVVQRVHDRSAPTGWVGGHAKAAGAPRRRSGRGRRRRTARGIARITQSAPASPYAPTAVDHLVDAPGEHPGRARTPPSRRTAPRGRPRCTRRPTFTALVIVAGSRLGRVAVLARARRPCGRSPRAR